MSDFILDRIMVPSVLLIIVLTVSIATYVLYDHFVAETFELRKDTWECAAMHAEMILIPAGKITVHSQVTVCDTWKRKS